MYTFCKVSIGLWLRSRGAGPQQGHKDMPKAVINSPAPDFVLEDYQGNRVQLSAFEGRQNVLLVFNRGFV